MSEGEHKLQGREAYVLVHASERPEERARLDSMHEAMTAYFGGKLTLAPIESISPGSILEMGAGSGAWTIHAATTFPEANILAVDLAEIPRTLPSNVTFRAADLTKPFDLQPARFDLVHARLFFLSLPNYRDTLDRSLHLVKPGGWLIIEDADVWIYSDTSELSPGILRAYTAWSDILRGRGINLAGPREFESVIRESGLFSEIEARKVSVPISGQMEDPALQQFGSTVRRTLNSVYTQAYTRLADPRLTEGMVNEALKELNDENKKLRLDFHFISARKHL